MYACAATRRYSPEARMAKRARARQRRQDRHRESTNRRAPETPIEVFENLVGDVHAEARLLRADDPTAEPLRSLGNTESIGLPVALVEPLRNGVIQHRQGAYDIRIAIASKMGLPLAGPISPHPAAGWTFGPRQGKWELADPTGTVIASCDVSIRDVMGEPAWTAQAIAVGKVLVVYGMRVGVRVPDGVPVSHYNDQYRAAELRKSLANQQACTAIVRLSQQLAAFRPAQ
jgi:hypothetical protein